MTNDENQLPPAPNTLPPAASAVPVPKNPNPLVRIGIGCLGMIVLGCVAIGAFAVYQNNLQEQNYTAGNKAYTAGDCATAVGPLGKAASGEPGTKDSDVARKAEAELQECEALLAADEAANSGSAADAVLGYSAFYAKYDSSPLRPQALTKGQELINATEAGSLTSPDLCSGIDKLQAQTFFARASETVPPLLYACGQVYEEANAFAEAVEIYDRFRQKYPEHELAKQVDLAFVRATIADAKASGAGELPAPQQVGEGGGSGDQVRVVIQNDSPEELNLVFSGPETRVEKLEPCTECEKFASDEPSSCPELGPVGTYLMAPGTYTVVVKAGSGSDVTPFQGNWELKGGEEYSSCFYVVTSGS